MSGLGRIWKMPKNRILNNKNNIMGLYLGPLMTREQEIRHELIRLIATWESKPDREQCQQIIDCYKEMLKKFL